MTEFPNLYDIIYSDSAVSSLVCKKSKNNKKLLTSQKFSEPLHLLCHNLKTSVSLTHTRNYLEIAFKSFCLSSLTCVFISSFEHAPVDYFHKSAIHQASVASVLAEDDNSCQDLTMPSQQVGQEGAA